MNNSTDNKDNDDYIWYLVGFVVAVVLILLYNANSKSTQQAQVNTPVTPVPYVQTSYIQTPYVQTQVTPLGPVTPITVPTYINPVVAQVPVTQVTQVTQVPVAPVIPTPEVTNTPATFEIPVNSTMGMIVSPRLDLKQVSAVVFSKKLPREMTEDTELPFQIGEAMIYENATGTYLKRDDFEYIKYVTGFKSDIVNVFPAETIIDDSLDTLTVIGGNTAVLKLVMKLKTPKDISYIRLRYCVNCLQYEATIPQCTLYDDRNNIIGGFMLDDLAGK